jgi:hypothetical protein
MNEKITTMSTVGCAEQREAHLSWANNPCVIFKIILAQYIEQIILNYILYRKGISHESYQFF